MCLVFFTAGHLAKTPRFPGLSGGGVLTRILPLPTAVSQFLPLPLYFGGLAGLLAPALNLLPVADVERLLALSFLAETGKIPALFLLGVADALGLCAVGQVVNPKLRACEAGKIGDIA